MDLVNVASGIQTARIGAQIDLAVAKKSLDAQKQQGAAMLQLLEAATSGPGDAMTAAATGLGSKIDTYG